jgi:hypothetical protein
MGGCEGEVYEIGQRGDIGMVLGLVAPMTLVLGAFFRSNIASNGSSVMK